MSLTFPIAFTDTTTGGFWFYWSEHDGECWIHGKFFDKAIPAASELRCAVLHGHWLWPKGAGQIVEPREWPAWAPKRQPAESH